MRNDRKNVALRVLILITTPKLARKATEIFREGKLPIQYEIHGVGTASSEWMDLLGLGSVEKCVMVSIMPRPFANIMLHKLRKGLRLGSANSGIAFTIALSGTSNHMMRMMHEIPESTVQPEEKEEITMSEMKYTMVAAVINQGYSEAVMNAARSAGASGGTVLHSRRIVDETMVNFWGMSIQEEKEIVLILAAADSKMAIMKAISQQCGIHSDAKGMVLSMPVDEVVGPNFAM